MPPNVLTTTTSGALPASSRVSRPTRQRGILHYAARVHQDWHDCLKRQQGFSIGIINETLFRSISEELWDKLCLRSLPQVCRVFTHAHLVSDLFLDVPRHLCPTSLSPLSSAHHSRFQAMWMFRIPSVSPSAYVLVIAGCVVGLLTFGNRSSPLVWADLSLRDREALCAFARTLPLFHLPVQQ